MQRVSEKSDMGVRSYSLKGGKNVVPHSTTSQWCQERLDRRNIKLCVGRKTEAIEGDPGLNSGEGIDCVCAAPLAAPVFFVAQDGFLRLVSDYRPLGWISMTDGYPMTKSHDSTCR